MSTFELEAATPVPTAVLPGIVAGATTALTAMVVYQLVRLGFWAAAGVTTHPGQTAPPGLGGGEYFVGNELLPSLISLGPTLLAGAVLGGAVGLVLTQTWERQGPLRAALTGALVTFVVAVIINVTVLTRDRATALTYRRWSHLLGYPSVMFVVLFAGVGISLYLTRARLAAAPTSFDLRDA